MTLTDKIIAESRKIDETFARLGRAAINEHQITFPVPANHTRSKVISNYRLVQKRLEEMNCEQAHLIVDDDVAEQYFVKSSSQHCKKTILVSDEAKVKNKSYIDSRLNEFKGANMVVGVGGGIICNVTSYIAEQLQIDLILVPTTVLSMADGNGGKVRLNQEIGGHFYKHFVKSFYEPNEIILDGRFLEILPQKEVSVGMVEIIKHGLFQSEALLNYLMTASGEVYNKKNYHLKKAVLWAADLKRVCLEIDPEEQEYGSKPILRAGHEISDRLEEESGLRIPHGLAVAYGIIKTLEDKQDDRLLFLAKEAFNKYNIHYKKENFVNFFK